MSHLVFTVSNLSVPPMVCPNCLLPSDTNTRLCPVCERAWKEQIARLKEQEGRVVELQRFRLP